MAQSVAFDGIGDVYAVELLLPYTRVLPPR